MRAIVIGNVAMDETIEVDVLPVEGMSILGRGRRAELGGKGANQAIVLARAGVQVTLVAAIGDDERGARVQRALADEPLDARLQTVSHPTDMSIILRDRAGANAIVTTVDCALALDTEAALATLDEADTDIDTVVVLQGNLGEAGTRAVLDRAVARGFPVVFNPSPFAAWQAQFLGRTAAVFANEHEAAALTGRGPEAAAREIVQRGAGCAVVTMGAGGLWLASPNGSERVAPADGPVADTAGAGDTLQGTAIAVARGANLDRTALEIASRAAALTIAREGTNGAFPTADELHHLMSGDRTMADHQGP